MSTSSKVLITGATGFIGSRLCERLTLTYKFPYRALVRNFSRANRIARMNAEMVGGDLSDPIALRRALSGCDAVFHLAHSEDSTALRETNCLIDACCAAQIKRFVHVSSVAVHGPFPAGNASSEETALIERSSGDSYCDAKAAVELAVQRAALRRKLPAVIIRPTIVYGPYSPFVLQVVRSAQHGEVVLIDNGQHVCNAVYVDDVCDAIWSGLQVHDPTYGKAYFITANQAVSWADFNLTFARMVTPELMIHNSDSADVLSQRNTGTGGLIQNAAAFARLLASPSFHQQLGKVPWFGTSIRWAKQMVIRRLSEEQIIMVKHRFQSRASKVLPVSTHRPSRTRVIRETSDVVFSNDLAKSELGWQPRYDFAQGAALTKTWLDFARLTPD